MIDPLKNGVVKSIEICKNAGIEVIMCTGDNLDTAKAIAINAGILPNNYLNSEDAKLLALRNNNLPKEDKIAL